MYAKRKKNEKGVVSIWFEYLAATPPIYIVLVYGVYIIAHVTEYKMGFAYLSYFKATIVYKAVSEAYGMVRKGGNRSRWMIMQCEVCNE